MAETGAMQAEGLDQAWVEDFINRWEAAWNSHEPARVLELVTDDIVYDNSSWPTPLRGPGGVRTLVEFFSRAFPDLRFETLEGPYIVPGQPKAAFYWKGSATHTGPLDPPGFAPTGKRVEVEGVELNEYREGVSAGCGACTT